MRFARLAPLTTLLLLSGCGLFNSSDPNAPLIAAPKSPIADVPIPAGFEMTNDSTSKVVPGNSLRFVDHHYDGSDSLLPVVKFYKDQLPTQQWQLLDQNQPSGREVSLHFSKNNEDLLVTITKHTLKTTIHIRIDPAGRKPAS